MQPKAPNAELWVLIATARNAYLSVNKTKISLAHKLLNFLRHTGTKSETGAHNLGKENLILLNKKPHIENHKGIAENKLAALLKMLKSTGMTHEQIQRHPKVRHYRATVRQAKSQLASIAKLESQIAEKAEIKAKKLAASKTDAHKPKHSASGLGSKRARREKKMAAAAAGTKE